MIDDTLFILPIEAQRQFVADCLHLGPNRNESGLWPRYIDLLLSIRQCDGKLSFYREVGRFHCKIFEESRLGRV